ncbi:hypothetical protein I350_04246 [Cryptococcus amylolentus CBS 6273]|uniref:ATP-dependent DNA ligase family profile domain-containing protein n=1 Tax=Cryptococcus amylolentus CBS 6273 TaxID=1296118 RepID=A0A1E3K1I1_9TREE|nr:hypothetical protein I350_04246 [Cryptococcus amylolentus CBS 6273]
MGATSAKDIPFEEFCKLIKILASDKSLCAPETIFKSWLQSLPRPFPPHTGKHLFRLLFPNKGSRRRYGTKEMKLSRTLEDVLGLRGLLAQWDSVNWDPRTEAGTGCLGREVEIQMDLRLAYKRELRFSLRELDSLLDELASDNHFSQLSQVQSQTRSPTDILIELYRHAKLSPYALSVLTQIILQDLRPLLDPLPRLEGGRCPGSYLRIKSNTRPKQLTMRGAMMGWDPRMWTYYKGGRGNMDVCADLVEELAATNASVAAEPQVGVNVEITKCRQGRSISDALKPFQSGAGRQAAGAIWAETKYDGYRMQIHVELVGDKPKITIFSKSMRNCTDDRINAHAHQHSIICHALNLPCNPKLPKHSSLASKLAALQQSGQSRPHSRIKKSVILEAEIVPYNEQDRDGGRGPGIEEFWQIKNAGVGAPSATSSASGRWDNQSRHVCLVFFDCLHVDGRNLLHTRYDERRRILENAIVPIPGFSMLAERTKIRVALRPDHLVQRDLDDLFNASNLAREEGLVLKAAESTYAAMQWPWVKLKKDYIEGMGDCVDLVMVGAGWDVDRARELRVDTSVFTTFYLGSAISAGQHGKGLPLIRILFAVSYGLTRDMLEHYNALIRMGRWKSRPFDKDDPLKKRCIGLSYNYTFEKSLSSLPSVLFNDPLCVEVMGAGFQKIPGSELFELRWPRLQKIHEKKDREWTEAPKSSEYVAIAHASLGWQAAHPDSHPRPSYPQVSPFRQLRHRRHSPTPESSSSTEWLDNHWHSCSTLQLIDKPDFSFTPSPAKRSNSAPELGQGYEAGKETSQEGSARFKREATPFDRMGSPRESPLEQRHSSTKSPLHIRGTTLNASGKTNRGPAHKFWDAISRGSKNNRAANSQMDGRGLSSAIVIDDDEPPALRSGMSPKKRRRLEPPVPIKAHKEVLQPAQPPVWDGGGAESWSSVVTSPSQPARSLPAIERQPLSPVQQSNHSDVSNMVTTFLKDPAREGIKAVKKQATDKDANRETKKTWDKPQTLLSRWRARKKREKAALAEKAQVQKELKRGELEQEQEMVQPPLAVFS